MLTPMGDPVHKYSHFVELFKKNLLPIGTLTVLIAIKLLFET